MTTYKTCNLCNKNKPLQYFNKDKRNSDGYKNSCKLCSKGRLKLWREGNKNSILTKRLKTYGLTIEEFNVILKRQDNVCAICKSTSKESLCVDHRHDTGKVRGLLCSKCNKAIGLLGDTPEKLRSALLYLEENH